MEYVATQQFNNLALHQSICLGLIWGYLHHFCAGIRYLFLDLEIGVDKAAANRSAVSVMVISLTLTAILGLRLFGLF
ncbi:MAG: succinate dehydrogenase, cytochrome b556 subunit [Burkholderiaceae bacterium]|nr:succinate dehydrogenase, cytochrome b556 subunit [Burkholderiaceae bacterium]